jgi:hypothetical protein
MAGRYDSDKKGKFTSVVRDGKGNPVLSGSGKAVMSRSFREAPTASTASTKPKATRTTGTTKRASAASTGGPARHRAQASSTGGPARYKSAATPAPARTSTGPSSRPKRNPPKKKTVAFPKLHSYLFDRRPSPWGK